MAKIVKMRCGQARLRPRRLPHPASEVAISQWGAVRAGEHDRIGRAGGKRRQVICERRPDHGRDDDHALACGRLWRAEQIATGQLGKRTLHTDGAVLRIDIAAAQRRQLTPAQTAEGGQEHRHPPPLGRTKYDPSQGADTAIASAR
jgi:hypothetical protein